MERLSTEFGNFQLSRFPRRTSEKLRAWDAADEYILQQIADDNQIDQNTRILIVHDQFGALGISLNQFAPDIVSDSWLTHAGIKANAVDNQISNDSLKLHTSLDYPQGKFDLVLLKVPKSLAMLEDQLSRLKPLLHEKSIILGGGMVKSIHNSTLKLFEKIIGPTKTSLAKKKARLILPTVDMQIESQPSPFPSSYVLEKTNHTISNHAAVFSRDSLDIGTRFFLQHIPSSNGYANVVDLGCGNGVVGLMTAEKNPDASLYFVDESFMAVASAKENFERVFGDSKQAKYIATDCLQGLEKNHYDLVLNNPPFHQQNVVGDFIAQQMFRESFSVLKNGGELWVIGNRHLGYHVALKKVFGNCEMVASNKKFVILKAIKPSR